MDKNRLLKVKLKPQNHSNSFILFVKLTLVGIAKKGFRMTEEKFELLALARKQPKSCAGVISPIDYDI